MAIIIKTPSQIEKMKIAGSLASEVLDMIAPYVVPGVTTNQLNSICHRYIVDVQKAIPAPLNYCGFPKSVCTSINHVVCHGIPSDKALKEGDILNIDVTVIKDGFHGDTSQMFFVGGRGKASIIAQRLVDAAYACLLAGINQVKAGNTLMDIASAIETYANKSNFSVVDSFCGHGIGEKFHEDPPILHCISHNKKELAILKTELRPGMVFTIEPMINVGKKNVTILRDGWTAVTKDKSLSAQWEHTLMVTLTGSQIFTLPQEKSLIKT